MSSTSPRPSKNGCEQLQSRRNTRGAADRPVCYLDHPNKTVFLDPLNYRNNNNITSKLINIKLLSNPGDPRTKNHWDFVSLT